MAGGVSGPSLTVIGQELVPLMNDGVLADFTLYHADIAALVPFIRFVPLLSDVTEESKHTE